MSLLPRSLLLGSILAVTACSQQSASQAHATDADPAPAVAETQPEPAPTAPVEATGRARWDGLGDTRLGMDEAALRAAWDGTLNAGDVMPGSTCMQLFPGGAEPPASPVFMFEDGRFVRYEVSDNADAAPGGGKVGMQQAEIERLYPGIESTPHKYTDGRYLRMANGENVLVLETNGEGMVTQWRVGRAPQVDYVEGCA